MQRIEVSTLEFLCIEPRGKATVEKFWVSDNNVEKLVKISENNDQDLMEYLSSIILKNINIFCVLVELGYDSLARKNCCLVTSFLTDTADVSYDIYDCEIIRDKDEEKELDLCFKQVFNKFSNLYMVTNFELLKKEYIRILFGKCLTDNIDSKLENIGLIFNEKTKQYRLPPSYDNGLSFNNFKSIGTKYCCVGKQYFETTKIIDYILTNYFEIVEDIITNLNDLNNELNSILEGFEIIPEKKKYILNYMKDMEQYINSKKVIRCK